MKSVDEALNFFGTDAEKGLSGDQIKKFQAKYGPNGMWFYQIISNLIQER